MLRFIVSTTFVLSVFVFLMNGAMAAPQVLAVLSTGDGAAMECEGGVCKATLSTYCLQRERESPFEGTIYHAANPAHYTLILDYADGRERSMPIDEQVKFVSSRGFKAVNATIPEALIAAHGAASARLLVQAEASLIPEVDPQDPNPLTDEEIALATGPFRSLGARVLDSRADADVARALGTMLRGVPEWRGWPQMDKEELWSKVADVADQEKIGGYGLEQIQREFDNCVTLHEARKSYSVGYCLMQRHDNVMLDLNKHYWETQAGS